METQEKRIPEEGKESYCLGPLAFVDLPISPT